MGGPYHLTAPPGPPREPDKPDEERPLGVLIVGIVLGAIFGAPAGFLVGWAIDVYRCIP
jgi:hypothetical protein